MKSYKADQLTRVLTGVVVTILILLPFHALFTTWLAARYGHFDLFRIWKELLLVPVVLGAAWTLYRDVTLRRYLRTAKVFYLIRTYILLTVALGLFAIAGGRVNANALIYALFINLRFLMLFCVCWVLASRSGWLKQNWAKIILYPAAAVVIFGLLQQFVLPANFLTHFGYGPKTIPAYQMVDQKAAYVRLQSTLRGPNPLGAYLVIIMTLVTALIVRQKKQRPWWIVFFVATFTVLFFTYSRSALLGTLLGVALIVYWSFKTESSKHRLVIVAVAGIVVLVGLVVALRHNNRLQNTVFHTDETSRSAESSNEARSSAVISGLKSIVRQPLGRGPGTAGPASVRNDHPARIAENYYIQIGQEVGVVGVALFVAINFVVGSMLWAARKNALAVALLASLVGISFINLLSHAWADDTLGYVWWGLAGIAIAHGQGDILNKKRKHNEQDAP